MPNRERSLQKYREGYARAVFDRASVPTTDPRDQEIHIRTIHFRQRCIGKLALKPGETVIDAGALFCLTHDIMRTPRAVQNIVSSLRDGGRIVVVGRQWAPWWRLLTNWRTWQGARRFITTFEGFRKPWSHLERLVSSLEVESMLQPGLTGGKVGTYVVLARK